MFDPSKLFPGATPQVYGLITIVLFLLGVIGWFVRIGFKFVSASMTSALDKLTKIDQVTTIQAENHLKTIQGESIKQTALIESLIEKSDNNMGLIIKEQSETNGSLRTLVEILAKKA